METTPNDLRQQQFEIKFRGYNADDVEVFRDLAATALEEARAEVLKLTEENKHLRERLEHLVAIEETLKAAVLEAQKNAENTIDTARKQAEATVGQAKREAELILKEAHQRRDEVVADMHRQMNKLVGDINKIRFIRSNYLAKIRALLQSQIEMVEDAVREDRDHEKTRTSRMPQSMPATPPEPTYQEDTHKPPPPPEGDSETAEPSTQMTQEEMQYQSPPAADVDAAEDEPAGKDESPEDQPPEEEDEEWKQLKEQLSEE